MRNAVHVVLGVTASIAIYKACELLRRMREAGYTVDVVMTEEATQLIRPVVFRSLSGRPVHSSLFNDDAAWEIAHVSLADRADAVVIAPATALVIGKLAHGLCDDLLTCTVTATKAPVVIAPAMNTGMYTHSITRENLAKLARIGYHIVNPRKGKLACGDVGVGCLADIADILKATSAALK